jgi:hypothetical protein
MTSDERVQSFVLFVDRFIEIAKERNQRQMAGGDDAAPPGMLEFLINAMSKLREKALNGKLAPSGGELTLGILRTVADFDEPLDSELVKAAKDIEDYYFHQMK